MKNITLIKQHSCIQLGHLYEHLFMRRVDDLFREHKLYRNLDYSTYGTTFHGSGIISIDIDLYTPEALALETKITDLKIEFGDHNRNISLELMRIIVEEAYGIYIGDKKMILTELKSLDTQPWQHLDQITQLDTRTIRRKTMPIYETNTRAPKPRTMHLILSLDKKFASEHRTLLPLFNVVGRMAVLSIERKIGATFGGYGGELHSKAKPITVTHELFFSPDVATEIDMDKILELQQEVTKEVFSHQTIARLAHTLQTTSYRDDVYSAHSFERIIDETGVLTGLLGWRKIALPENILRVLDHTSIEIKLGRRKVSVPLIKK
jgi:hypothetical protein